MERMAGNVSNTSRSIILSEVTNSILAETSGELHGMRSAGAIKTKVWRAQQKFNPMPKIPRNHQDIMDIPQLPNKLTNTKDDQYICPSYRFRPPPHHDNHAITYNNKEINNKKFFQGQSYLTVCPMYFIV